MGSARDNSADPTQTHSRACPSRPARPSLHPVIASQDMPLVSTLLCRPCVESERQGSPRSDGAVWPQRRAGDVMRIPYIIPSGSSNLLVTPTPTSTGEHKRDGRL